MIPMVFQNGGRGAERFGMEADARDLVSELKGQDLVFMLLEIAQLMEKQREPKIIIDGILSMLSERLHLILGRVIVLGRESGPPKIRYCLGSSRTEGLDLPVGRESLVGQVLATGKIKLVPDIDRDSALLGLSPPRNGLPAGKVAFFAVPIFENDTVLGALVAFRMHDEKRSFVHDMDMLRFSAAVIGQSLGIEMRVAEEMRSLRSTGKGIAHGILGNSAKLNEALRQTDQIAASDAPAMLLGESGTGKEKFARMIHQESRRAEGPFVCINCAAIPPSLLESELFGYEKGGFTGANQSRKGKIECADGGTLFLDEIGDLPLELQAKLLRVIQERQIERVGGSGSIEVDFRIITATNVDLQTAVNEGRFRLDLFYRLNVIPIFLPPLRERNGDVRIIALHFLHEFNHNYQRNVTFDEGILDLMESFDWPGNIRQLANVIERAGLTAESRRITREQIERILVQEASVLIAKPRHTETDRPPNQPEPAAKAKEPKEENARPYMKVQERETEEIATAIRRFGGNKTHAARSLGLTVRQLRYRIQRLGIAA
ncbi:MAG TPA: sigma 54-interacting transcriptional regulator [Fibrobacteria bacterium]|nr:sigma 54-interacting transcriptional regulator [Fibrobacteria bacterium]